MTLTPRALGVVLCLAASGCFGGPTSDWPPRSSGDGTKDDGSHNNTPPDLGAGAADAAVRGPGIDAGAPLGAGTVPCVSSPADGGGADAGAGAPPHPFDAVPNEPSEPDAGCR